VLAAVRHGRRRALIDLSGVADVAPGVLGVLLRLHRRLLGIGGSLVVVSARTAEELFGALEADELLWRYETLTDALAGAGGPSSRNVDAIGSRRLRRPGTSEDPGI
jgi:hypothetical protein